MTEKIICTVCPLGCEILVSGEGDRIDEITGYSCKRGLQYGTDEFIHPVRILTTTVATNDPKNPLLPVRSDQPVPKELIMDCMKEIKKMIVEKPVKRYDIIVTDILGSGVNIVATGEV